jgi:hypothetical protein
MAHEIIHLPPKVDPVFWRQKFRLAVSKSGNMELMKYR